MISIENPKYRRLVRLKSYLNYEISSSVLLILWFVQGIGFYLMILAALVLLPLMIKVLFEQKKTGWLIFLSIIVLGSILLRLLRFTNPVVMMIITILPLIVFYFYCFALKWSIGDWIEDERARNSRKIK